MKRGCVLVVDDEPEIRHLVQEILEDENYQAVSVASAGAARAALDKHRPDLVLLDIWMPDCDGITLLKEWMGCGAVVPPVVMISGHGTIETAVEAIRIGASDFIEKPLSTARLLGVVEQTLRRARRATGSRPASGLRLRPFIIGRSPEMGRLRSEIEHVAALDAPVLISGERGSGRNLAARAVHFHGAGRNGPAVVVNLAAVEKANLLARLFGIEQGGQIVSGCLEQARDGSLVLEEITAMDAAAQDMLRGALERNWYRRIGGGRPVSIECRILATTDRDLESEVAASRFDEDLWDRLGLLSLYVPALREHRQDIPELIDYFQRRTVDAERVAHRRFSTAALNSLRNYAWPGNVAELKALVQRLLLLKRRGDICEAEIRDILQRQRRLAPVALPESFYNMPLREARDRFERAYLLYHLERAEGNIGELAQIAELERTHLYRKLKGLGIGLRRDKDK
ncbi:MAG: sigma-54 dependent transcriptional regulator [Gammaproteobacteria bacterium]|nr:sigma-54 dependent transcriptional regulator [Gammaproteobacteria bacterium]